MKTVISRAVKVRVLMSLVLGIICGWSHGARAQTNSWTNSVSGNWQDAHWSLGLPTTSQDVSLTNAGWKALAIGPATAQNFPETLILNSLTISSPSNSYNTLLLNFAGINTPLTVRSMTVASNSAVTMYSSALLLNGPNSVGMQVGGEFSQNDSVVSGSQVNVGYIGPGLYNFNSGIFTVSNLWVGGAYSGVFNQNGGTNTTLLTDVEGGEYDLNGGYFNSLIYFNNAGNNGGTFRQRGGILDFPLTIFSGHYILEGGIHNGSVTVPSSDGLYYGSGDVVQSGGTNFGNLTIGDNAVHYSISGTYTMSNGVSVGAIAVTGHGAFTQWAGRQIASTISVDFDSNETRGGGGYITVGSFTLNGGNVSCSDMVITGNYDQYNATNNIAGTLSVYGTHGHFRSDGVLCANNVSVSVYGMFVSFNGTTVITNELRVYQGVGFYEGGDLIVSDITLNSGAICSFGGRINQSGIISIANASVGLSGGPHHLGRLLNSGSNSVTLYSPQCKVDFADSSGMGWSGAIFTVSQWSGSLYGGGQHQILFGTNASGLTTQQLTQIQFQNPAGLAPGNYPARILATGEIVPNTGAPLPPMANLVCATNGLIHLSIGGDIGRTYTIEVSTDLVHWNTWTDQFNTCGTMTLDDNDSTNCPQRFYRAHAMP